MSDSDRSMSVRNSAASAASVSRTLASSASVQRFSPGRTGSAAAPERAAAVIFRPPSVQLGNDLRSEQSRENKCLPGAIANKPAGGLAEAQPVPDRRRAALSRSSLIRGRLTDTVTGRASAILASCTALMGTAAAAAARSDRGWCEPGDTRSGPDHPGAAGRTAPRFIHLNWGRGTPAGSGIRRSAGRGLVEPAAEPNREGRATGLQAPIAAKEGGTAGQPPASLVPPAKPYRQGPRDRGDLTDDNPGEAAHHAAPRRDRGRRQPAHRSFSVRHARKPPVVGAAVPRTPGGRRPARDRAR